MSQRCSAKRRDGQPCNAWAVRGSDPPLCAAHGGTDARIGAPPGNTNALTHNAVATRLVDLAIRFERAEIEFGVGTAMNRRLPTHGHGRRGGTGSRKRLRGRCGVA
jgi:hypothetical protein